MTKTYTVTRTQTFTVQALTAEQAELFAEQIAALGLDNGEFEIHVQQEI